MSGGNARGEGQGGNGMGSTRGGGRSYKGGRKRGEGFGNITITDSVRIGVTLTIENFRNNDEAEYEFPSAFSNIQRAYVHKMCLKYGLKSKSRGKGQNRYVTVYKVDGSSIVKQDGNLTLEKECKNLVDQILTKFPVSTKERVDLLPVAERSQSLINRDPNSFRRSVGRLASITPKVPPSWGGKSCLQRRKDLPIWEFKSTIIQTIETSQIVLITGATGSGKTTQVPQLILEDAFVKQTPVRVIVCQPRRLAVTTVAERVAQERDEKLGETIGYQIRLESVTSPNNIVTFCTYGVLLRSLMGGDNFFNSVTHIIIDEVHERDKMCDFLLTILKDTVVWNSNLKLIMMSATVDSHLFSQYFPTSGRVDVPGRMFPVEEFFLEDILNKLKGDKHDRNRKKNPLLEADISDSAAALASAGGGAELDHDVLVEPLVDHDMDKLLEASFLDCTDDLTLELTSIIENDASKVDYMHSTKGVNILMIAGAWGKIDLLELALSLGAKVHATAPNGWSTLQFAEKTKQTEAVKILHDHLARIDDFHNEVEDRKLMAKLDDEKLKMLEEYQSSFDDDEIDHLMIVDIIYYLQTKPVGGVLVFLPGYDDIMMTRDYLLADRRIKGIDIFTMHSQIMSAEYRKAFVPSKPGIRKVILATNIAETGITLSDVIYVIDAGKVKEMTFDALTNCSMLQNSWISKSSAVQRKGRAGRCKPGEVYRLFSSIRFRHMSQFSTPEIMRTPLLDLCLQTKILAPPNTPIADFLAKVPEPPPFVVTRNAVQYLKTIEALDQWEEVTSLGCHLLDIPLDPVFGKILLYGVMLCCLDPVLTICCCISYRDPFLIESRVGSENGPAKVKKRLAGDSNSDHQILLNVYQEWENAKDRRAWSRRNFVSHSTMEMISGMRNQVLGSLKDSGFLKSRSNNSLQQYNVNSGNWSVIKACLVAGFYPNIARYDPDACQLRTAQETKVKIHHSSVCKGLNQNIKKDTMPSDWLVYTEMTRMGRNAYIKGVTFVSAAVVALLAGPAKLPASVWESGEKSGQINNALEESSDSEEEMRDVQGLAVLNLDPWISFRMCEEDAQSLLQLRQKTTSIWLRRLSGGSQNLGMSSGVLSNREESDRQVISCLAEILNIQDLAQFQNNSPRLAQLRSRNVSVMPSAVSTDLDPIWQGQPAVFFIVRPSPRSLSAVEAAKSRGKMSIWSFSPGVERKMFEASNGNIIYVFFCVITSSFIQGCASLTGEIVHEGSRVGQRIHWVNKQPVNVDNISHLIDLRDYEGKDLIPLTRDAATQIIQRMNSSAQAGSYDSAMRNKPYRRI